LVQLITTNLHENWPSASPFFAAAGLLAAQLPLDVMSGEVCELRRNGVQPRGDLSAN